MSAAALPTTLMSGDVSFRLRALVGFKRFPFASIVVIHVRIPVNKDNNTECPGMRLQYHTWAARIT